MYWFASAAITSTTKGAAYMTETYRLTVLEARSPEQGADRFSWEGKSQFQAPPLGFTMSILSPHGVLRVWLSASASLLLRRMQFTSD